VQSKNFRVNFNVWQWCVSVVTRQVGFRRALRVDMVGDEEARSPGSLTVCRLLLLRKAG